MGCDTMSQAMLKIENLKKKYDNSDRIILNNIDLSINEEDFLCVLGPSGCGKSTLIRCIAGFEDYKGNITVNGEKVVKPGPDRIMVFQDFNQLFPWKTVLGNITYALKVGGMKDKEERKEKAEKYLNKVNLLQYKNYYPHQLSGGMKQRVAIARALMRHPAILLADEPVASLDPVTGRQILGLLKSIHETDGVTILMNSHNLEFSQEFSDRLIGLKDGKVVFDGKTADLTDSITTQIYNKNDTQIENKRGIAYE